MELHTPSTTTTTTTHSPPISDEPDSTCSTPYVSAPSSPSHNPPIISGFYYSAPASPVHFTFSSSSNNNINNSFEFEFSARFASTGSTNKNDSSHSTMSTAEELFLNGKIRPMKLSTHLETPQSLCPLLDDDAVVDNECNDVFIQENTRGRDMKMRDKRRTRSMSPMRELHFVWNDIDMHGHADIKKDSVCSLDKDSTVSTAASADAATTNAHASSSSRSSSAGRSSSKRWVFLKDFLRSKSEGRSSGNNKFWSSITFSPAKEKKTTNENVNLKFSTKKVGTGKSANRTGKRRVPAPSAHELHYTANRAQAEEMRKKTYLPYRQGLLGCLGFSSKGYGAVNGLARALNPVSST